MSRTAHLHSPSNQRGEITPTNRPNLKLALKKNRLSPSYWNLSLRLIKCEQGKILLVGRGERAQCILRSYFGVSVNAHSFWSFDSAAGVSLTHATPALHATLAYTAMGGGADTDRAGTAQWLEVSRSVGRERALVVGGMDDGAEQASEARCGECA